MQNYQRFADFIKEEDKVPVSLSLTTDVLNTRKIIEDASFAAKRHSQLLVKKQSEIALSIKDVKANAALIN